MGVSDILKRVTHQTRELLKQELEIKLGELAEKWHFSSLEKIFIENRIYRDIEECTTWDAVMAAIWKGLKPYLKLLRREVTDEDVKSLTEIRIKRISKFNSFEADEYLRGLEDQIETVKGHLAQLTRYTINWFKELKKKYGTNRQRKTEITTFDRVAASFVRPAGVVATADAGRAADVQADQPQAYRRWLERNVHAHQVAGYRAVTLSVKRAGQAPGDATDVHLPSPSYYPIVLAFGHPLRTALTISASRCSPSASRVSPTMRARRSRG